MTQTQTKPQKYKNTKSTDNTNTKIQQIRKLQTYKNTKPQKDNTTYVCVHIYIYARVHLLCIRK